MHITALDYYTLAIVMDSAITLYVGWRLGRKADKAVLNAAENIEPAIRQAVQDIANEFQVSAKKEIARSIEKLFPLILKAINNVGSARHEPNSNSASGPITEPGNIRRDHIGSKQ